MVNCEYCGQNLDRMQKCCTSCGAVNPHYNSAVPLRRVKEPNVHVAITLTKDETISKTPKRKKDIPPKNAKAMVSFQLSFLACILAIIPAGLLLGIIAVIYGCLSLKLESEKLYKKHAICGIILGCVSAVVSFFFLVFLGI